ncbi:MAG: hypothetical protein ACRCW0_00295 [Clostridium sp.]|nr:hypothetical protein [Clostridium sp. LY3-2]MCR6516304.1 hypothetical protein [Clostridium sp. LY3-2]
MDLLKTYGPKELARITCNDLRDRKIKRKQDITFYEADRYNHIQRRLGNR